jgi:F0F1-type ATP synthase membrane subunit b/b'
MAAIGMSEDLVSQLTRFERQAEEIVAAARREAAAVLKETDAKTEALAGRIEQETALRIAEAERASADGLAKETAASERRTAQQLAALDGIGEAVLHEAAEAIVKHVLEAEHGD